MYVFVRGVDVCASLTLAYVNKAFCPLHYKLGIWINFGGGGMKFKHSTGFSPRLFVDRLGLVLSSRSKATVIR